MSLDIASLKKTTPTRPAPVSRSASYVNLGVPAPPVTTPYLNVTEDRNVLDAVLELVDGSAFRGISFGANAKSVAGECVFQTGA